MEGRNRIRILERQAMERDQLLGVDPVGDMEEGLVEDLDMAPLQDMEGALV